MWVYDSAVARRVWLGEEVLVLLPKAAIRISGTYRTVPGIVCMTWRVLNICLEYI